MGATVAAGRPELEHCLAVARVDEALINGAGCDIEPVRSWLCPPAKYRLGGRQIQTSERCRLGTVEINISEVARCRPEDHSDIFAMTEQPRQIVHFCSEFRPA